MRMRDAMNRPPAGGGFEGQRGFATATVILLMLISAVGGAFLLKRVRSNAVASGGYYQARTAALAAQAGMQSALAQLENDPAGGVARLNAYLADTTRQWLLGTPSAARTRREIAMDNGLQRFAARILAFDPKSGLVKLEGQGEGPGGSESSVYGVYRLGGITSDSPVPAKYVWFMAGESRNVDQQVDVWGNTYFGGGVHFNGGAANSVMHGTVKIARGAGLESSFDEHISFCYNTYIQTPFKSQGGGADFTGDAGFEEDLSLDAMFKWTETGKTIYVNKNVTGGHTDIMAQGNRVVHAGALNTGRVTGASSILDNGGPIDLAAKLGMDPGPEDEIHINMAAIPAGKRYSFASLGIGSYGNLTGADLTAAYMKAAAAGDLYKDFLVIEVNSQMNFQAASPNTLAGNFVFDVTDQVNVNLNLPASDPASVSLWHVRGSGKLNGFGGAGLFRGYVNVTGSGSVIYQWPAGCEFQGAIHHVSTTAGFQLNGSTGPLKLTFDAGVFEELSPLGILIPPGGVPVSSGNTVKLVDVKIRPRQFSRWF